MFTGLITDVGEVASIAKRSDGAELAIRTHYETQSLVLGESIAVDGACLTVTKTAHDSFWIAASLETLRLTTLGDRSVGDSVHLERALTLSDRLGGHLVLGHVDGVGTVTKTSREGNAIIVSIRTPDTVSPYLLPKGSITVDGVSLTLNRVGTSDFDIALIPHTQENTKVQSYKTADRVNLEADVLGKYVFRFLQQGGSPGGIDLNTLVKAGFSEGH